jgi:alpha-tubulin suppressor-like RCC1 family protein
MTTPTGTISISDINIEIGRSSTAQLDINLDPDVRTLAGVPSGVITMNDLRGKSFINNVLYAWGYNRFGRLGDGSTTNKSSPVSVVGGFNNWLKISGGFSHSAAIRADGTAWGWGYNRWGQLGNGATIITSSPVAVTGGITNWTQISAGWDFTAAIRSDGTAWGWGLNAAGQLGDSTTVAKSSPVAVVGGITNWAEIHAGRNHTKARRSDGSILHWGAGGYGVSGDGLNTTTTSPISISGGITWSQVSTFSRDIAAIRSDGTAWGWGRNFFGAIGDGSTTIRNSPVAVTGGITNWSQISSGTYLTTAIRSDGTAWAWGRNDFGQVGDNSVTNRSSPVAVTGGITNWSQISSGGVHAVALRSAGTVWAWGGGGSGRIGDETTSNRSSPVLVAGGFTSWTQIDAADSFSFGIRAV